MAVYNERYSNFVHDIGGDDANTVGPNVELHQGQRSRQPRRQPNEGAERRGRGIHAVQRSAGDLHRTDHLPSDPADRPHRKWRAGTHDPSAHEYEKRAQHVRPVAGVRRFTGT